MKGSKGVIWCCGVVVLIRESRCVLGGNVGLLLVYEKWPFSNECDVDVRLDIRSTNVPLDIGSTDANLTLHLE